MKIVSALLDKYKTQAEVARQFGVERATVNPWFREERFPSNHWETITQLLPDVTIEQCHREFSRKPKTKRKPRNKRH